MGPPPPRPLPLPKTVPPPPTLDPPPELAALWDFTNYGSDYLEFNKGASLWTTQQTHRSIMRIRRKPEHACAFSIPGARLHHLAAPPGVDPQGWAFGQLCDSGKQGWFPPCFVAEVLFAEADFSDYGPDYLEFKQGARILRLPDPLDAAGWAFGQLLATDATGWYPPAFGRARGRIFSMFL